MNSTSVVKSRSVSADPDSRVEEERVLRVEDCVEEPVVRVEDRVAERVVVRVAEESSLGVVVLTVSPARGGKGSFCIRLRFLGLVSSPFEVREVLLRGIRNRSSSNYRLHFS